MGWSQNMNGSNEEHYRFQSGSCMESDKLQNQVRGRRVARCIKFCFIVTQWFILFHESYISHGFCVL
jgi:hypothetical protein